MVLFMTVVLVGKIAKLKKNRSKSKMEFRESKDIGKGTSSCKIVVSSGCFSEES